jgi:hypothetical protein
MGILSYGYKASKTPVGKKVVETVKNIFKGGKQKTTGTEVVNPFKFKPSKSKLEKTVRKLEVESKKSHNRILGDIEKAFDDKGLQKARTNLRQTTQKMAGEPVTKSGFSKGKDIKKAKGGRIGRKGGGDLGMQSVKYGLDNNPKITAADPKAKFIAKNKKKKFQSPMAKAVKKKNKKKII